MRRLLLMSLAAWLAIPPVPGASQTSAPPDSVLTRVASLLDGIRDYTVTLDIVSAIEQVQVPPMRVTMYFKQPNRTHFASEGFALLPREVVRLNLHDLPEHYTVDRRSTTATPDGPRILLRLIPRSSSSPVRRLDMLVDPRRSTPEQVSTVMADGRTVAASFTYVVIDGHPLPSAVTVSFSADTSDAFPAPLAGEPPVSAGRNSVRAGSITIRYSDYRLNTGLPDDLFTTPE
jgi:outer membrane lipoprotein-sorting protein